MKILFVLILIIFICSCYSPYEKFPPEWCNKCNSHTCCSARSVSQCISVCNSECNIKVKCP